MIRFAILFMAVAFGSIASATQPCFSRGYAKQVVAVKQYAVVPNVYYFVGAPIRAESIVEHTKRADPDWKEFEAFKAFREYQRQQAEIGETHEQVQPANRQPLPNVFASRCAGCHNAQDSAGGFALDGSVELDADEKAAVMRSVLSGEMPKGKKPLTPEELGALVDGLFLDSQGF